MKRYTAVAWYEFRWQLRRRITVMAWLAIMLLPLLQSIPNEEAAVTVVGAQSRIFLLVAPIVMIGVVSRDTLDGVATLIQSTGVRTPAYLAAKWLGLFGVQLVLLLAVALVAGVRVGLDAGAATMITYHTLLLVTILPAGLIYTCIGLVFEGLFDNPWWTYPAVLLVGLATLQLDSSLALAYDDSHMDAYVASFQDVGWPAIGWRLGAYVVLALLLLGGFIAYRIAVERRRRSGS